MSNFAPIALFAYNRTDHLKKTVQALRANDFASESDLFIFSDGPKTAADQTQVAELRAYLKTITGFRKIEIIEQQNNQGLANSIITGVSKLVAEFGRIIVLEDDIVTSPQFLRYMNNALDFYKNESRVMHISGYNFPMTNNTFKETFFIVPATCWGWATWDRAWKFFIRDANLLVPKFTLEMIKDFNLNNANNYFDQLLKNQKGLMNTWAIFWHAALYLNHGLSLHPAKSFCFNIGHDGTGEHCSVNNIFDVQINSIAVTQFETEIKESSYFRKKVEEFFRNSKPSILVRIRNRILRTLSIQLPIKKTTLQLAFIPASETDAMTIFDWRNDPETRAQSHQTEPLVLDQHLTWFKNSLANPNRNIFMVTNPKLGKVAMIRRDLIIHDQKNHWLLSWMVNPNARGLGIGKKLLAQFVQNFPETYVAEIKKDNIASLKMVQNAGFKLQESNDLHQTWRLEGRV